MVSMTTASRYITSASRYKPRYQSNFSMYLRGLIPWNFAELAEAVPIEIFYTKMNSLVFVKCRNIKDVVLNVYCFMFQWFKYFQVSPDSCILGC